jgi:hypothetical protein
MKKVSGILTLILASFTALSVQAKTKLGKQSNTHHEAEFVDLKDYETALGPNEPVKTFSCRSKPNK